MSEEKRSHPAPEEEQPVERIDLGQSLRKQHKQKKPVNRAALLIVSAVLVAAAAGLAIALPRVLKPAEPDEPQSTAVSLTGRENPEVVSLHIDGGTPFTITKQESTAEDGAAQTTYHIDIMEDALVNQSTCSSAFVNAAKLEADQLVEADAQDMAQYGLDTPSCTMTVEYADGSLVLEMGDLQPLTGQIYCRLAGESDVYILRPYYANVFGGSLLRYRSLELEEISTESMDTASIEIRQPGEEPVTFLPIQDPAAFASGTWKMTQPKELWLDAGAVTELVGSVASVSLYDYQGRTDDPAQYGLDAPWFEITVTDTAGRSRTLRLGDQVKEENRYYCAIDDSGEVFTVSGSYLDFARDFKVSYYLDAFTNIVSITAIDGATIEGGGAKYELSIERQEQYEEDGSLKVLANGDPDYLETYRLNGVEQQEDAFKDAYQTLIGVTISNMAEEELVDETQAPVLTVTYHLNNGAEPLVIEYLPYDINNYCVRREGRIDLICKKDLVDAILPMYADLEAGLLNEEEE